MGAGGGAVDLMMELMSCYLFLPSSTPLVAFGTGNGKMVYVDAAASNDIVACSGCVGGRACERVRFALPEDWGRNSLVGGEGFTRGVAA